MRWDKIFSILNWTIVRRCVFDWRQQCPPEYEVFKPVSLGLRSNNRAQNGQSTSYLMRLLLVAHPNHTLHVVVPKMREGKEQFYGQAAEVLVWELYGRFACFTWKHIQNDHSHPTFEAYANWWPFLSEHVSKAHVHALSVHLMTESTLFEQNVLNELQ